MSQSIINIHIEHSSLILLFCSSIRGLATPFISVLCHSDLLFHPGCAWSSSPAGTWHCSLHYLSLSPGFLLVSSWSDHSMLASLRRQSSSSFLTPALLRRTHSFVDDSADSTVMLAGATNGNRQVRQHQSSSTLLLSIKLTNDLQQAATCLTTLPTPLRTTMGD